MCSMVIEIAFSKIWSSGLRPVRRAHRFLSLAEPNYSLADPVRYLTEFQWDLAKYPIKQSLRTLCEIISKVSQRECEWSLDLRGGRRDTNGRLQKFLRSKFWSRLVSLTRPPIISKMNSNFAVNPTTPLSRISTHYRRNKGKFDSLLYSARVCLFSASTEAICWHVHSTTWWKRNNSCLAVNIWRPCWCACPKDWWMNGTANMKHCVRWLFRARRN